MGNSNNRKSKTSTSQVALFPPERHQLSSIEDVWRIAVDVKYKNDHPDLDPRRSVGAQLGIGYKMVSALISGERGSEQKLTTFALGMKICNYPEGFDDLKTLMFPEVTRPAKIQRLQVLPMRTKA
jgi:hypothetical protein